MRPDLDPARRRALRSAGFLMLTMVLVLALLLWVAGSMAPEPTLREAPTDLIESTSTSITPPPTSTITEILAAAEATAVAVPVVERTTTTLPDPCGAEAQAYVNGLPYQPDNKVPTTEAYRVLATCLGWTQATQDLYRPGVIDDIFPGESRQCPGLQRGQYPSADCTPNGAICAKCTDTGFWQITRDGWGPRGLLCVNGFYCSAESIKAKPWDSMRSGLLLIMLNPDKPGQPWNYDADSCRYHHLVCSTWPKHPWENLP